MVVNALTPKNEPHSINHQEVKDLAERLNDVELDIAEAKKFSQLSSEVFVVLQNQINEIKYVLAVLIQSKDNSPKSGKGIYL
jgi:hypothetical protein